MGGTAAIVGSGLVGRAWAIAFARAGWSVRLWDPEPQAPARARAIIADLFADLADNDLLNGQSPDEALARISASATLAEALDGVDWVQENAPEDVEVKRRLWAEMDPLAAPSTVLASSTSGIVPSRFTEALAGRARCLTAHPINPPYLVPAVELVPAPWTAPQTVARAGEVMQQIDQVPIPMQREIDGFVVNRLQGALLEEAFRLVEDGICGVEEVDAALRDGLALRWSFIGPFETIDLNAPGGVRDYVERYNGLYASLFASMQRRADWTGVVLDEIEAARRGQVPKDKLDDRQRWRDRRLMALRRHKKDAARSLGD